MVTFSPSQPCQLSSRPGKRPSAWFSACFAAAALLLLAGMSEPSTDYASAPVSPNGSAAGAETAALFDEATDWYDPNAGYVRIAVAEDGVYAVSRGQLEAAGVPASADASTFRVFERGEEIPLQLRGDDSIVFVGQRNRGTDEVYAYDGRADFQSSDDRSLYTDTTYYWMTWGGATGLRYSNPSPSPAGSPVTQVRDTLHVEEDNRFYLGRPFESEHPLYKDGEGYYWREFRSSGTTPVTFETTLDVGRRVPSSTETLDLRVRLNSSSASCHRVELEASLQNGSTTSFEALDVVEWRGYARQDLGASIAQDRIPASGLTIRLRSTNDTFDNASCPDPERNPNYVLFDYVEARYTRTLESLQGVQQFPAPTDAETTFQLSGYGGSSVEVFHPAGARAFSLTPSAGVVSFTDRPARSGASYWAVDEAEFRTPARVLSETTSNWSDPAENGADYVVLTTQSLQATAEELAAYRQTQDGYDVAVVNIQDVFDEFDYGRPTPIAIRRFVQAMSEWSTTPRFLTIWGDAQYPIYTDGSIDERRPEWSVLTFGYPPSDGWFAMQSAGPNDWSETIAVGRVPIRSNEQGTLYLDKLQTYEAAPRDRWQQRMLLLAGGTSTSEQQRLQDYSNRWGEIATGRSTASGDTLYPAGMDSIRYYKSVNDPLDVSFQDSLSVDLQEGAGWLNYFGHSAAQTWEIVTDPPAEFNNAGRLPIVVSLGCRTGSFAGGRYEVRSAPSLGEQLVVGSVDESGSLRPGGENGAIAHWGSSALGNLQPSGLLNDALIDQVFQDTVRVLGTAIQDAKAEIAASNGGSSIIVRHLLQYGLLGDAAIRITIPDKPDFHLETNLIRPSPTAPTPSNRLTINVELQNRGLVPEDSVSLTLNWLRPDGSNILLERRLQRFALETTERFTFDLDETTVGTNTFRLTADPAGEYAEILESDNQAEREQVVFSEGLELVSPTPSGVVRSQRPVLRVNVTRQSATPAAVDIQVDTTQSFDSPALQETSISGSSLGLDWTPPSPLSDRTVYYWRARLTSANAVWKEDVFTVRTDSDAQWEQSGPLFSENQNLQLERDEGDWTLSPFEIEVTAFGLRSSSATNYAFNVGGSDSYTLRPLGFGVLVIDGVSGEVKGTTSFATYDVQSIFDDRPPNGDQQEAIDALRAFLDTEAETGDYVLFQTRHLARDSGPEIDAETVEIIQNLGSGSRPPGSPPYSAAIDTLTYNDVWVMATRKGFPSETQENVLRGNPEIRQIELTRRLNFRRPAGTSLTPRIGPVSSWDELRWTGQPAGSTGSIEVEVLAADSTRLLGPFSQASATESLQALDPEIHPYIRLRATLADTLQRQSPQLQQWEISYTGVPEIAVDPVSLQSIPDTLQEGSEVDVQLSLANLGVAEQRPIYLTYTWTGSDNTETVASRDTVQALPVDSTALSRVTLSTTGRSGNTLLTATATSPGTTERFTFNNTAVRNLRVEQDDTPPVVRVFSDNRQIQARPDVDNLNLKDARLPFVPQQPTLEIRVEDDNPFFPIDDTSHVDVYLAEGLPTSGTGFLTTFERVSFTPGLLQFDPANPGEGMPDAILTYTPDLSERDSTYTLRVEGTDGSGNEIEPYEVSFRVQSEQVIRDVYPYPNPMNTRTTFAFRVEGGQTETLRDFRLRIYTVAGRLIREFSERDLETGSLRVGWNMLPWDGRDEDGDRVATGVYLYRVSVQGNEGTFTGDVEKVSVIR